MRCLWIACLWMFLACSSTTLGARLTRQVIHDPTPSAVAERVEDWQDGGHMNIPETVSEPSGLGDFCGKQNFRNFSAIDLRVAGVDEKKGTAKFGEFPWMVAIIKETVVEEQYIVNIYQCGGSLIRPGVVLTAAHCVQGKSGLSARAGEWDTQHTSEPFPTQTRAVRHVVIHEDYYPGALYNDVALLFLESPMDTQAPNVGIVCLPDQDDNMDNLLCVASGWGVDDFGEEGQYQSILKKVELPIVPRERCLQSLRQTRLGRTFKLHSSFLCAGGKDGQDTCTGDGGSPLVCPSRTNPQVFVQTGIVSWGIGCATETPGVYADVAKFRDWIDSQISIHDLEIALRMNGQLSTPSESETRKPPSSPADLGRTEDNKTVDLPQR